MTPAAINWFACGSRSGSASASAWRSPRCAAGAAVTEFDRAARRVMVRSGGYLSDAMRGVATHYGITQRVYMMWRNEHHLGWKNLVYLTPDEAKAIYRERFWDAAQCDDLPEAVREIHFDTAVAHHVRRAMLLLHEAAQLDPKGELFSPALEHIRAMAPPYLRARYLCARYRFCGEIMRRDRSQLEHVAGWMSRLEDFA